jgi:hypothetical protein
VRDKKCGGPALAGGQAFQACDELVIQSPRRETSSSCCSSRIVSGIDSSLLRRDRKLVTGRNGSFQLRLGDLSQLCDVRAVTSAGTSVLCRWGSDGARRGRSASRRSAGSRQPGSPSPSQGTCCLRGQRARPCRVYASSAAKSPLRGPVVPVSQPPECLGGSAVYSTRAAARRGAGSSRRADQRPTESSKAARSPVGTGAAGAERRRSGSTKRPSRRMR